MKGCWWHGECGNTQLAMLPHSALQSGSGPRSLPPRKELWFLQQDMSSAQLTSWTFHYDARALVWPHLSPVKPLSGPLQSSENKTQNRSRWDRTGAKALVLQPTLVWIPRMTFCLLSTAVSTWYAPSPPKNFTSVLSNSFKRNHRVQKHLYTFPSFI